MNINNIVIVRATDEIPFDGIVKPISESQYLTKPIGTEFAFKIHDILVEKGIISSLDYSRMTEEDYFDNKSKEDNEILKQYLPYTSDYNSMVLFALNGLCPDDVEHGFGNNTFSNKKCVVITPLVEHIDNVVSLLPTDTAIKGSVHLSSNSILLIEEETYLNLSPAKKEQLSNLGLTVKTFETNLKEAVHNELMQSGKYIPEELILTKDGFKDSKTSEMQKETIRNIAQEKGIAQVFYYNILTHQNDEMDKLESVKDEFENALLVRNTYLSMFLEQLLLSVGITVDNRDDISKSLNFKNFIDEIGELINQMGIENYKKFVDNYNANLEKKKQEGSLMTPEEIVIEHNKSINK